MKENNIRYLMILNKKLKKELDDEAAELQLPLAAYIRVILMNRKKFAIGVVDNEPNKNNEI